MMVVVSVSEKHGGARENCELTICNRLQYGPKICNTVQLNLVNLQAIYFSAITVNFPVILLTTAK